MRQGHPHPGQGGPEPSGGGGNFHRSDRQLPRPQGCRHSSLPRVRVLSRSRTGGVKPPILLDENVSLALAPCGVSGCGKKGPNPLPDRPHIPPAPSAPDFSPLPLVPPHPAQHDADHPHQDVIHPFASAFPLLSRYRPMALKMSPARSVEGLKLIAACPAHPAPSMASPEGARAGPPAPARRRAGSRT